MREHYNLAGLQNEYDLLRAKYGMGPAIVQYSSRRATGGLIQFANNTRSYHIITISSHMPYHEQLQTLAHEAAHAFCGHKEHHSEKFWRVAESFGCARRGAPVTQEVERKRAERITHNYDCPACGYEFKTHRKLKGLRYHKACYDKGIRKPLFLRGSFRTVPKYSVDSLRYL